MLHKQSVDYTYFCHKKDTYTWIDHILCNRLSIPHIKSCTIIPEESNNNSDHLPIQLKFSVKVSGPSCKKESHDKNYKGTVKPDWTNDAKKEMYASMVSGKISDIPPIDIHKLNRDTITCKVNERLEHINSILISTAKEAGCLPLKTLKVKT